MEEYQAAAQGLGDGARSAASVLADSASEGAASISAAANDAVGSVSDAAAAAASSTSSALSSSPSSSSSSFWGTSSSWWPASAEEGGLFGSLNTVFARMAFVFLLLVGFYLLGNLGVAVLGWYTRPDKNPVLVSGMLNGASAVDITQNPAETSAILVSRSNNATTGAEFSWSLWLFLNPPLPKSATEEAAFSTIFTKGSGTFDPKTGVNSSNGPGMYVRSDASGACELGVAMDTTSRSVPDWIRVPNMPLQKWVHVLVRLENMQLQVYVNAAVAASHTLSAVPRQNYYDVHVCPNGGFSGSLSTLRYFDHAVSALRMRTLLAAGPSTAPTTATTDASKAGGNYTYLSDFWY